MLVSFFASSLKRTVPQQRWDTYLISSGEWSEIDVSKRNEGKQRAMSKLATLVFALASSLPALFIYCAL
jgi:ATPase complex subunit ATP10